jgi:hypothetical protein
VKDRHGRTAWTPDKVRQRIRVGVVLKRVQDHALGKVEMSATQLKAAEILLRKAVPDMRAVEHSGTVNHVNYDAAVLGLLNGSGTEARDASSTESVTH